MLAGYGSLRQRSRLNAELRFAGTPAINIGQSAANDVGQLDHSDRLAEDLVGAHSLCFATDFIIQFCTHQDARRTLRSLAELPDHFQSCDPWHMNIDQCHVDLGAADHVNRFLPVARLGNAKSTPPKSFRDHLAKSRVIIGYEKIGDQHGHDRREIG